MGTLTLLQYKVVNNVYDDHGNGGYRLTGNLTLQSGLILMLTNSQSFASF